MSDNRKYYYLKLKENYFDDDSIVLLESMQDGVLYSNILLKLYLKSLKHGGRLQLDEDIPYTAQMIATITRQQATIMHWRKPIRWNWRKSSGAGSHISTSCQTMRISVKTCWTEKCKLLNEVSGAIQCFWHLFLDFL